MASNVVLLCCFAAVQASANLELTRGTNANAGRNANANANANANSNNDAAADTANPIRRVVSMLQNMAKKVEAEGKKEQELYDKFMCYCKNSADTLGQTISDNNAQIPAIQSNIEEATSKLATTKAELAQHQTDRDAAKAAMAKATAIREKEHAAFAAEAASLKAN